MLTFSKSIIEETKIFSLRSLILISRMKEDMQGADLLIYSLFSPLTQHIFEFTYLLKFLCNLKINTCDIFLIICSHAQSGTNFSHQEAETQKKKKYIYIQPFAFLSQLSQVCHILRILLVSLLFKLPPGIGAAAAAAAESLQWCSTLCDPIDGSPLGSPILGMLSAAQGS